MATLSYPQNSEKPIFKHLWNSHFTFCEDKSFAMKDSKSSLKENFINYGKMCIPEPAKPLKPSNFDHRDFNKISERITETKKQFYPKICKKVNKMDKFLQKTNFKQHSDDKFNVFFDKQKIPLVKSKPAKRVEGQSITSSSVVFGEANKIKERISETKKAFAEVEIKPSLKTQTPKFTCWDALKQDLRTSHYASATKSDFRPVYKQYIKNYEKYPQSMIQFGDPDKAFIKQTETGDSYQQPPADQYFKDTDTKNLYKSNLQLGDNKNTFASEGTLHKTSFVPFSDQKYGVNVSVTDRNKSFLPKGDLDQSRTLKEICGSTSKDTYINHLYQKPLRYKAAEPATKSNFLIGNPQLYSSFYKSTKTEEFKPQVVKYKRRKPSQLTSIPSNYYKNQWATITGSDFLNTFSEKEKVDKPTSLHLRKSSHVPPFGNQFFSDTTQSTSFPPQTYIKNNIIINQSQLSSVPMGTLGKFIKGSYRG